MKVLVIKTSSLGDVIHTLPALTDAATAIPCIKFDWVVEESFVEIPSWHSAVSDVIPIALRRWSKQLYRTWKSGEWKQFKSTLKKKKYDCVIDAQGLLKSAFLTRYISAPVHGLDKCSVREPFASRFYTHPHKVSWEQHAVERVRKLFAQSLGYIMPESKGQYNLDREQFGHMVLPDIVQENQGKPALLFLHGTTRPDKHWPIDYWCDLATKADSSGFVVYLLWGNEKEKLRAETIARSGQNVYTLPRLNLATIAVLISTMSGVVSVDSGLGHLTAALNIPGISLYGPTSPVKVGTYGSKQLHLTLAEGDAGCMRNVSPKIFRPLTPECVWSALESIIPASANQIAMQ